MNDIKKSVLLNENWIIATEMIMNYMIAQNRPYAVTDIVSNLHGVIGKTLAIKALANLAEEQNLLAKTYGKTIIYVAKQVYLLYLLY